MSHFVSNVLQYPGDIHASLPYFLLFKDCIAKLVRMNLGMDK